jgi:hypothetical protein
LSRPVSICHSVILNNLEISSICHMDSVIQSVRAIIFREHDPYDGISSACGHRISSAHAFVILGGSPLALFSPMTNFLVLARLWPNLHSPIGLSDHGGLNRSPQKLPQKTAICSFKLKEDLTTGNVRLRCFVRVNPHADPSPVPRTVIWSSQCSD